MRFMFRLAILGLAAFGAKTLYDRYAPKPMSNTAGAGTTAATTTYVEQVRVEVEEVTAAPYDTEIGLSQA